MNWYRAREIYLFAYAALVLCAARYQLRFRSVDKMRRWATAKGIRSCPREQLLLGFRRAARRVKGSCLVRALALQRMLSRYGYTSQLKIGVGRNESGFEAHAWLVDGDEVLVGGEEVTPNLTLLANWSADQFH